MPEPYQPPVASGSSINRPGLGFDGAPNLSDPALGEEDWDLVGRFQEAMYSKEMEYCVTCMERWFDMKVCNPPQLVSQYIV